MLLVICKILINRELYAKPFIGLQNQQQNKYNHYYQMDKERSKSSLQISKSHHHTSSIQQQYGLVHSPQYQNQQKIDSKIVASNLKEANNFIAQEKNPATFNDENPEREIDQNQTNSQAKINKADTKTNESNLKDKKTTENNQQDETIIDFKELFAKKKKYVNLAQIDKSFESVIESGKITISPQKQSICGKKDRILTEPNLQARWTHEQEKIKLIIFKKQQMLQQLNQLFYQQREARSNKKALILAAKANHQSTKLLRKSRIITENPLKRESKTIKETPQNQSEKKFIALILKQGVHKQLYFELKEKQLLQKAEQEKEKEIEQLNVKIQEGRQRRRSKALERLERKSNQRQSYKRVQMRSKTNFQTESAEGLTQNQFFTHVNIGSDKKDEALPKSLPKQYIYKKLEKQSAEKERQRKDYEASILQKRREKSKVDFEEIRIHLEKYKKIKIQSIQLEKQKIQNLRNQQKERLKKIRDQYGFLTKIKQGMLQEEKKSIEMMESQLNTKANYRKKMKEYFLSVKQKTQPTLRQHIIQKKAKTSASFEENQEVNDNTPFNQQKRSKNSKFEKNRFKNNTHFMQRKKMSSLKNSRTEQKVQKVQNYKNDLSDKSHSFQRKQKTMMDILKNEKSSMQEIQKAFGIFKDLNKSFWQGPSENKKIIIKKQGNLLQSHKYEQRCD